MRLTNFGIITGLLIPQLGFASTQNERVNWKEVYNSPEFNRVKGVLAQTNSGSIKLFSDFMDENGLSHFSYKEQFIDFWAAIAHYLKDNNLSNKDKLINLFLDKINEIVQSNKKAATHEALKRAYEEQPEGAGFPTFDEYKRNDLALLQKQEARQQEIIDILRS